MQHTGINIPLFKSGPTWAWTCMHEQVCEHLCAALFTSNMWTHTHEAQLSYLCYKSTYQHEWCGLGKVWSILLNWICHSLSWLHTSQMIHHWIPPNHTRDGWNVIQEGFRPKQALKPPPLWSLLLQHSLWTGGQVLHMASINKIPVITPSAHQHGWHGWLVAFLYAFHSIGTHMYRIRPVIIFCPDHSITVDV